MAFTHTHPPPFPFFAPFSSCSEFSTGTYGCRYAKTAAGCRRTEAHLDWNSKHCGSGGTGCKLTTLPKNVPDVKASNSLHAIYIKGLTSRDDATHFSTTCHNFGGFRQPRDVCSEAQWGTTFANCEAQFSERPMCKSVAGLPGFKRYTVPYHDDGGAKRYKYEPGAANVDAMTAFLMARVKWYPDDAAKMFQNFEHKGLWYKLIDFNGVGGNKVYGERHPTPTSYYFERLYGTYDSGAGGGCKCRNPWAADFNPSDPGERVWLHKDYDVILGELETPGKPFCLTTLHWNENWVSEVRSKWTLSPSPLLSLHLQMDLLPEPCYLS